MKNICFIYYAKLVTHDKILMTVLLGYIDSSQIDRLFPARIRMANHHGATVNRLAQQADARVDGKYPGLQMRCAVWLTGVRNN